MELYDCSLWEFLKNENQNLNYEFSVSERIDFLVEILNLIIFIQSKNYAHRDIKPSNILLQTESRPNSKIGIKKKKWVLCDFGLSSLVSKLSGSSGTPCFASMEQFDGNPHIKSDNYSVAKLAVLLLFKWQLAWNFLASPINKTDYQNRPWKNHQLFTMLSKLVNVNIKISKNSSRIFKHSKVLDLSYDAIILIKLLVTVCRSLNIFLRFRRLLVQI